MYEVRADLPLHRFVGHELNQIALGRFQTQLHFAGVGSIFVEGRWELRDPSGDLLDAWQDRAGRDCNRPHRLPDLPSCEIDASTSFTLVFDASYRLTILDDSEQYESFSVHFDGSDIYV